MAYNAMGCIICKEEEDFNVMEVAMHDTRAQRRRMPHLNDLYRFSMAALGDRVGLCPVPPPPPLLPPSSTHLHETAIHTHLACMYSHDWACTLGFCHLLLLPLARTTVVLQSAGTAAGKHQINFHRNSLRRDKLVKTMKILQQTLLCLLTGCLNLLLSGSMTEC